MPALQAWATAVYRAAGLAPHIAATVAQLQVLTDAMGRRTHGLAMLPLYLTELAKGTMAKEGAPEVLRDRGVCALWDGRYLPGLWLVHEAVRQSLQRAREHGVAVVAMRRTHHIGCLAALLKPAADAGFVAQLFNSDPAGRRVAPFGGTEALFTPNPFAIAYPTAGSPVLVDICASITTTSMTRQKHAAGEFFEHPWLLDAKGQPTRDPAVLEHATPRGSLQLLGGTEAGHKGFGLALMVEALTQGLSGHGRKDAPAQWGGNVCLIVLDPGAFAGVDAFVEQTEHLAQACRTNRPVRADQPVRLPGDAAAAGLARAQVEGLGFDAATTAALRRVAAQHGIELPIS